MVYTVLIHHALLVISIINGFTATGALRYNCVWFFLHIYTSTLKSLFTIILGLKTKMWNIIDTWIILENHNFLLLLPQQNVPLFLFYFLQRNHCDTTTVDSG